MKNEQGLKSSKILILGAGATGQVFERALKNAGASVAFSVRSAAQLEEVRKGNWDHVFLCVSSTALRDVKLIQFLDAVSVTNASVVSIQSGLYDRAHLLKYIPEDRLISLSVPFVAFRPDHGGEMIVYLPSFAVAFCGPPSVAAQGLCKILNRGGIRTKRVKSVLAEVAIADLILNFFVDELERVNWSLTTLMGDGPRMKELTIRMRKFGKKIAANTGAKGAFLLNFLTPFTLRTIVKTIGKTVPFDLQEMLKSHFSRHTDQTRERIREYAIIGRS